jgi:replicative DNA helicase
MKSQDLANEVMAVMTLIGTQGKPQALLATSLRVEHFYDIRTKELYSRIMALAKSRKELPTYKVLQHDTTLTEEAKQLLDADSYPAAQTEGDAEQITSVLEKLRKCRIILDSYDSAMEKMKPDEADPDDALYVIEQGLLDARTYEADETLSISPEGNFLESVTDLLGRQKPSSVPTGFHEFDNSAGGLPRGGLTTLAATSGGGKSCMALQMAVNAFRAGHSCAIVTLEMQKEQTTGRLMSNLSGVSYTAINLCRTNEQQKLRINRATQKFDEEAKRDSKIIDIHHRTNMTISEIALELRAFAYDLIVIDYINLLNKEEGASSNDAMALGEIAKAAKLHAGATNAAWVMLAQLNEQGDVKYSKAIRENSDYMLTWTYGEVEKETHLIEVNIQKARHSESFKFNLKENFSVQTFMNAGNPERNADMNVKKGKRSTRHPSASPMPGMAFEDEDEDDL